MATLIDEISRPSSIVRARIQAASGLLIAIFVGIHLLNTFLLAFSFALYNDVQMALRLAYQQPLLELLLLSAIVVHMGCGIAAMVARRGSTGGAISPRLRWQRYAGWFLLVFVGGHVLATRGASFWFDIAPRAEGLGFTLAYAPAYFYPYYFLLGLAGLYHGATGVESALARFGVRVHIAPRLPLLTVLGALAVLMALLGAGGWLYATPDAFANDYAKLVLGIVHDLAGGAR